jgi:fucose permease
VKASKILVGNYILMALFLLMILVWPVNPVMVWVASIGLGFAVSSVFPTLLALAETRMKVTGAITGLFFLGTSLGGMIVPTVLGQIFEYVGSYQAIQALFLGACLGLGVLIIVIVASNRMGERTRG